MKLFSFNLTRGLLFLSIVSIIMAGCRENPDNPGGDDSLIDDLVGTWVRVESNNPVNDYMIVEFSTSAGGIITDKASSGFAEGAIKWKDVVASPDIENALDHQELGSDGAYYPGTIRFNGKDELAITIENSGAATKEYKTGRRSSKNSRKIPGFEGGCIKINFREEDYFEFRF